MARAVATQMSSSGSLYLKSILRGFILIFGGPIIRDVLARVEERVMPASTPEAVARKSFDCLILDEKPKLVPDLVQQAKSAKTTGEAVLVGGTIFRAAWGRHKTRLRPGKLQIRQRLIMEESAARRVLEGAGLRATPQRVAIAACVLDTPRHPSADEVHREVQDVRAEVSRATVYNTLRRLVERGLLKQLVIERNVVFDPNLSAHHHFLDTESGKIVDLPGDALPSGALNVPEGFDVSDVQIVLRGKLRSPS